MKILTFGSAVTTTRFFPSGSHTYALGDLRELAGIEPRVVRVIECRFFGGLSVEETAETLGISVRTVKRDWLLAKAWLYRRLGGKTMKTLAGKRIEANAIETVKPSATST